MLRSGLEFVFALVFLAAVLHWAVFSAGRDRGLDRMRSLNFRRGKVVQFRFTNIESKRFWKLIDYGWLSLAALGLFFAADNIRRADAAALLEPVKREIVALLSTTPPEIIRMCTATANAVPQDLYGPEQECSWIVDVNDAIAKARLSTDWPLDQKTNWADIANRGVLIETEIARQAKDREKGRDKLLRKVPTLGGAFSSIGGPRVPGLPGKLLKVNSLIKKGIEYKAITESIDRSVLQKFWPFILVLALAVRWTKVTGERRLEKF